MLFSHRFGSVETLSRARYWMGRLGFEVAPVDPDSHDASRLSLNMDFSQAAAAFALIGSIEHSDPEGWPGFLTPPKAFHPGRVAKGAHDLETAKLSPARLPIHWGQRDDSPTAHPVGSKVSEYMFGRWE